VGSRRDVLETDRAGLRRRLAPRDDVVVREAAVPGGAPAEAPRGSARFEAAAGPFSRYRRCVEWAPGPAPGSVAVTQTVEWTLAVPYWRWLYGPPVRGALRDGVPKGVRPWWSFPNRLSPRQATVVATMALLNVVVGLLFGVLTQVLTFASADIGDGSRSQQAAVLATVRLGTVVTLAALALADRVGRRRIALWSLWLAAGLTVLSAAAPGLAVLAGLQLLARNLAIAGLLAVDTIAVEELPAGSRAMASGLGALAYGLGAGVAVLALPLADLGPWGWRLVFLVGLAAVPLIASGSRWLPESDRFERMIETDPGARQRRIRGRRFLLLAGLLFLLNLFVAPASQLQNDFLRTERGFSGAAITLLVVLTGTPAALGVLIGGRLADVRGRRFALVPGLVATGVLNAAFFVLAGPPMWVAALGGSVLGALCVAPLGVLAPELFPTARRGSARGALTAIAVSGSVVGLLGAGVLVDGIGYGPTFLMLGLGPVLAAGLALGVPETSGVELEELNREGPPATSGPP
jgi:MFS family permease